MLVMVVRDPNMSTGLTVQVSQWMKNVQFWLLPGVCVVCRKPSSRNLDLCLPCQATLASLERPCRSCALPLPPGDLSSPLCGRCLGRDWRMARTVAAFAYTEPASTLISRFKYQGGLQHGRVLGTLLLDRLKEAYRDQPCPQLLLPVPLHPARLRERGFNQALVLARYLGKELGIPVAPEYVTRIRQTPPQQGLSARERKRNLRQAFRLNAAANLERYDTIALIDDVVTTMSTVHELARVLRREGAGNLAVHVWCLARA